MFPQVQSFQSAPNFQPMASAARDEQGFCEGMEKMYGQKISFDPDVKYVIDEGIKEARLMDPEKRAQVIETAGYLCYDIMIVESLQGNKDAEVAKGAKQAAENYLKKHLKEMTLSEKKAFCQEAIGYARLLEEAKQAAENYKEKKFDEVKPSVTEELLLRKKSETRKKVPEENCNVPVYTEMGAF